MRENNFYPGKFEQMMNMSPAQNSVGGVGPCEPTPRRILELEKVMGQIVAIAHDVAHTAIGIESSVRETVSQMVGSELQQTCDSTGQKAPPIYGLYSQAEADLTSALASIRSCLESIQYQVSRL
jgi:hypothetical protein